VPLYRIYFRNQHAFIIGRDDFPANDDAHAIVIARTLADACSDLCSTFELWQSARRVEASASSQIIRNADEIAARVQTVVLERALVLRESRCVVAESARLLEHIRQGLEAANHSHHLRSGTAERDYARSFRM
jgi:hypothetical protein